MPLSHLIPVWGEIRTFRFHLKGHEDIHPDNEVQRHLGRATEIYPQRPLVQTSPWRREAGSPLAESDWRPAVLQGDPEKLDTMGLLCAPELPFCKTRT